MSNTAIRNYHFANPDNTTAPVEFFLPISYIPPGETKQNLKEIEILRGKASDGEEILERPVQAEVQGNPVP